MSRGREAGHVQSDLSDDDLGGASTDAGDGVQPVQGVFTTAQAFFHLSIELLDEFVQGVQMSELLREQETLMCSELAEQGTLQLGKLGAQLAAGEVRQEGRVSVASNQCGEDLATGGAQDVAGNVAELDVGAFECC